MSGVWSKGKKSYRNSLLNLLLFEFDFESKWRFMLILPVLQFCKYRKIDQKVLSTCSNQVLESWFKLTFKNQVSIRKFKPWKRFQFSSLIGFALSHTDTANIWLSVFFFFKVGISSQQHVKLGLVEFAFPFSIHYTCSTSLNNSLKI